MADTLDRIRAWRTWTGALTLLAIILALSCLLLPAMARAETTPADLLLDEHVNQLTSELRCLVCQNQTIADSQAELAMQLKREVRQQLARGATDQQVRDFMVARYGEFVLYRPPVSRTTALLWVGPVLLLLGGAAMFALHWRDRRSSLASDNDDDDEAEPDQEVPA